MADNKHKFLFRFRPVDRITILYIFLTASLLLFGTGSYENVTGHYLVRAGMLLFIWMILRLEEEFPGRLTRTVHQLYPLLFLTYFFPETAYLGDLFSHHLDPGIVRAEISVLGFLPSEAFSRCCSQPWFSELMHFGYFSFYLIITFFVVYYYAKLPHLAGKEIFIFLFSFYTFYLIFIFFPSEGPQYYLPAGKESMPDGYLFTHIMQKILLYGDKPTGAFPSSHIGMTWLMMYFFFKDKRKVFYWWLIPAILLTFSTVYIKAHYALDVMAGFLTVPVFAWSGNKVYDWFFATYTVPEEEPAMAKSL